MSDQLVLPLPAPSTREILARARPAARRLGEDRAQACAAKAEVRADGFRVNATAFVLNYLDAHGASGGEDIVAAGEAAGIKPHDARAWGGIFARLSTKGEIRCLRSDLPRAKGHGTSGGKLWERVAAQPA